MGRHRWHKVEKEGMVAYEELGEVGVYGANMLYAILIEFF